MFWNDPSKKPINSDEFERLSKRIIELSTEIQICKTSCQLLETDLANLRGKFSARLKGLKEEDIKKESETIIKDEFVAFG